MVRRPKTESPDESAKPEAEATPAPQPSGNGEIPAKKKGFLEEEQGRKSAMRAMNFVSLCASILFGLITLLYQKADGQAGVFITFGFLLAAFAPKALQKFAEAKKPK